MAPNGIYDASVGDVDIIFAGGGTAACVTAGRLAKANPDLKIVLVEGGPNNYQNPTITNPAFYLSHLVPESKTALFYKAQASKHLNGREAIVPMGGCLGGGSSINFMMYTRAQAVDYDSFKTEGWYAKDLIPLSNKLETYHVKGDGHDQSIHGHSGPINISDGGFRSKAGDLFLDAAREVGHNVIEDLQDFEANGGFSPWRRYVSPDGKRQDAAHCYVHPLIQDGQHPNIHILPESKVIRVLFDESSPPRAIGIEYKPNSDAQPSLSLSKPVHKTIKAKKLVVVSAGALGSPQILERSGVGSPEVLKKAGVEKVVADVPGVGENYQDHHLILYPYKTSLGDRETIDALLSGRKDFMKAVEEKDPILGWNAIDACAKLRPTAEEITALGPEFQEDWDVEFAKAPTRPLMLCGMVSAFLADPTLVDPGQYITLGTYTAYPFSRGRIHITSTEDVLTGYDFDTGFLNHRADIKKQLWAYKMQRELARRLPYYRGELELGHPKFPASSGAALNSIPIDSEDAKPKSIPGDDRIQYSKEDDELIEDWVRGNLNTTWHSMSTCSMKPREKGGVVDKDLNVYGTTGLKVADLSICPENVGANTNNTALVVGEKAAVIIARELGIEV